jgi:hypothetical protein
MFERLSYVWSNYGFEILAGLSIAAILLLAIFRLGKKGTYSKSYYLPEGVGNGSGNKRKGPPKESTGERVCREFLERTFSRPFSKNRPYFLSNPVTGGNNLEIDCYNEQLKLGVEYSGIQHYRFTPFFHKNKEAFYNQKYRDQMKKVKCRENGICLIVVPYTVSANDIPGYLASELKRHGYLK